MLNFQYRNRFRIDDFVDSALLYRSLAARSHDQRALGAAQASTTPTSTCSSPRARSWPGCTATLLPLDEVDFGAEGFGARVMPYRSSVTGGEELELEVEVRNPFRHPCD